MTKIKDLEKKIEDLEKKIEWNQECEQAIETKEWVYTGSLGTKQAVVKEQIIGKVKGIYTENEEKKKLQRSKVMVGGIN